MTAFRCVSCCFLIVAVSCLSVMLHAGESEVPVDKRLEEIIAWTAADTDAATVRLIDCLSDRREIQGAMLRGRSKETWKDLRSRTNAEITVSAFALHHLCQNARRSKDLLAKKIHDLDRASDVDHDKD